MKNVNQIYITMPATPLWLEVRSYLSVRGVVKSRSASNQLLHILRTFTGGAAFVMSNFDFWMTKWHENGHFHPRLGNVDDAFGY